MAPKLTLHKAAWQWAETVPPEHVQDNHVLMAYRMDLVDKCSAGNCRKNCKGNPHCLVGLGERKWFAEIDDSAWHNIENPNDERREKGNFVGLKNLGATCYVNTFIQVWFHNLSFQQAMFKYIEESKDIPIEQVKTPQKISCSDGVSSTSDECTPSSSTSATVTTTAHTTTTTMTSTTACTSVSSSTTAVSSVSTVSSTTPITMSDSCQVTGAVSEDMLKELQPTSVGGQLQLIFALLRFSQRRYIDPSHLIEFLGLDAGQQQDAQEFSKLFISVLEECLSHQSDPQVKNLIQTQFSGHYIYVTRCLTCQTGSQRPSKFYELDLNIKGHKTLDECLQEFLQNEDLNGDNQYMCTHCNEKKDACRRIQLRQLPPVLNLQLLRFVYDRKTAHKKKLNTFIQFPEVLDMSTYVGRDEGSVLYNLEAVLIHRGPSAYSGHYVAHIKDRSDNIWYKFNDETIEKMGSRSLQLGNEEDIDGKGASKKPRTAKGCHNTRNAYMLVYSKADVDQKVEQLELSDLSERVQSYIKTDNALFENWITDMVEMQQNNVQKGKGRQDEIQSVYQMLPVQNGEPSEWISADWLSYWMSEDDINPIDPIDNQKLLCTHNKLDPNMIERAKCISTTAADILYSQYRGGPRLPSSDMCKLCVQEECKVIWTKLKLAADSKIINEHLKAKIQIDSADISYWVGKQSLRGWKRLVMEKLDVNVANGETENTHNDGDGSTTTGTDMKETVKEVVSEDTSNDGITFKTNGDIADENKESMSFNEDLLCNQHGKLTIDASDRKLVPAPVWEVLKGYFPNAPEFDNDAPFCAECKRFNACEQARLQSLFISAQKQKADLSDLYHNRQRPTWKKGVTMLNLVPTSFLQKWRRFIRDSQSNVPVDTLINRDTLCPHNGFICNVDTMEYDQSNGLEYVTSTEWAKLKEYVKVDLELQVYRIEEDGGQITFVTNPDSCPECIASRQKELQENLLSYTNATIYIRRVAENKLTKALDRLSPTPSTGSDIDSGNEASGGKRKSADNVALCADKRVKLSDDASVRRSSRHHKARGEKAIVVAATHTLQDLKLKIMNAFSVPPFDQHLILKDKELIGNDQTLSSFDIMPESVLYLQVDEPNDDISLVDEISKSTQLEEGFKGTGLLGSKIS